MVASEKRDEQPSNLNMGEQYRIWGCFSSRWTDSSQATTPRLCATSAGNLPRGHQIPKPSSSFDAVEEEKVVAWRLPRTQLQNDKHYCSSWWDHHPRQWRMSTTRNRSHWIQRPARRPGHLSPDVTGWSDAEMEEEQGEIIPMQRSLLHGIHASRKNMTNSNYMPEPRVPTRSVARTTDGGGRDRQRL
jgi:hypothetical protein